MSNSIGLKSIGTIINEQTFFFVDSYQRGYKWDDQQVIDLLNDIQDFIPGKNGDFYCLQPVVVKEIEDKVELIDGQQRMTTIFIILSYLGKEKYNIDYKTRKGSAWFLSKIINKNEIGSGEWTDFRVKEHYDEQGESILVNNIDNLHFFNAYKAVKDWFSNETDKNDFYRKLLDHTKVIWYQVNEDVKSQEIFARINIGKIPLTNSELIKAQFLSSNKNTESIKNQIEVNWDSETTVVSISGFDKINILNNDFKNQVALEWDFIEKELQNDELWYFISDGQDNKFTRIDLLLDIVSNKNFEYKKQDPLHSFHYFAQQDDLKAEWNKIAELYYTIQDWFQDVELYHLVGYNIAISGKNKIKELYKNQLDKSKSQFKNWLHEEINNSEIIKKFGEYGYGSGLVKNTLLLFNIKTHIKTSTENNFNRFPFKSYKINKWSIEHIHAQKSEGLNSKEQWEKWLTDSVLALKKMEEDEKVTDLISEIEKSINNDLDLKRFKELFDQVIQVTTDESENDMHDISNLALLDGGTNSAISNGIFASKRQMILQAEKEHVYIPICTKNVFLKYYTNDPKQFYFWSKEDRADYLQAIEDMLDLKGTIEKS